MKKIFLEHLIPMDIFTACEPIKIDLVYAQKDHPHNFFKEVIYQKNSKLWAHKDLAVIILLTARKLYQDHGYILELKDCMRTFEAQAAMQETKIVKANPQWMKQPDPLLSTPGARSHPRAMAIDVCVYDSDNKEVDMGTHFDFMGLESHREYTEFPQEILNNRKILENTFMQSAEKLKFPFLALPSEWWDFRFPAAYSEKFEALCDADLPPQMQMTQQIDNNIPDFPQEHFDKLAEDIITIVDENI